MRVEVRKNERGAWCVWLDGQAVSDHSSRTAAAAAAIRHSVPEFHPAPPPDQATQPEETS